MAKFEEFSVYKIPTYAIYALEYWDYDGLEYDDIKNIKKFLEMLDQQCPLGYLLEWDKETLDSPYFTSTPEFGLPTSVTDCKVYRVVYENV